MRYLLSTVLALAACGDRDTARDTRITDSIGVADTGIRSNAAQSQPLSAIPDRLLGSWSAQGYDAGSSRPQEPVTGRESGWNGRIPRRRDLQRQNRVNQRYRLRV